MSTNPGLGGVYVVLRSLLNRLRHQSYPARHPHFWYPKAAYMRSPPYPTDIREVFHDYETSMTTRVHSRLVLPLVKDETGTSQHTLQPKLRVQLSPPTWTVHTSDLLDTDNDPTGNNPLRPSRPNPCITPCSSTEVLKGPLALSKM